jgi:ankyrin repeat protein
MNSQDLRNDTPLHKYCTLYHQNISVPNTPALQPSSIEELPYLATYFAQKAKLRHESFLSKMKPRDKKRESSSSSNSPPQESPKFLQFLLECGANVNLQNARGMTPLHIACHGGHFTLISALLNAQGTFHSLLPFFSFNLLAYN